jgi:hypothetical protein
MRTIGRLVAGLLLAPSLPPAAAAQDFSPEFYYLFVGTGQGNGALNDAGLQNFQRLRIMVSPTFGAVGFDVAYEQVLTLSTTSLTAGSGALLGGLGGNTDWLPLQGTIAEGEHGRWRHKLDRLSVDIVMDKWDLVIGRQTISYATTLFLTPTDPFVPFDPADPFRAYRAGVDAVRLRVFPGTFTTVEGVARISTTVNDSDTLVTALARVQSDIGGIEVSAYGGAVYDEPGGAVGVTVTEFGAAFRGEAQVRRSGGETVVRLALGADRSWNVSGRTLYVALEYQRDGFGAGSSDELVSVATSPAAQRGELQALGRNEAALMATYEVHPLATLQLLTLSNFNDPSVLLSPSISYSASSTINLRGGLFFGFGSEFDGSNIGSEYGNTPPLLYASLEGFF